MIASTFLEKDCGFWAAYLLPTAFYSVAMILLGVWSKEFGALLTFSACLINELIQIVKLPPQQDVLPMAGKSLLCALKHGFNLDAARPAVQSERYGKTVPWDDHFISELKRGLLACRVL